MSFGKKTHHEKEGIRPTQERNVNLKTVEFKTAADAQNAQEALVYLFKHGVFPEQEMLQNNKTLMFIRETK